ncbi:hypothetical protein [Pseudogulbenkiania ferrooxidans]|uniref:Uncharacterized protein n=1 Tax=Pseudogulbenkiania ferrooxidans 2002 TaxID=279714 RepID=B9YYS5_9NEIS|nr:hypothetical protein [Pseudogulbenkiania ferrooxidans]EEG10278.1 hypothetical protein FuraDRAFT_0260 [Pseudogulbenkiania ferrooxidans 2002]
MTHSNAAQQQAKTALLALAAPAKPTTKIEQFRALLPDIEQRIRDGVRHGQIIDALASAGLQMTESEFRNALCRERKRQKGPAREASQTPAPPAATPAPAAPKPTAPRGDFRQQRDKPLNW